MKQKGILVYLKYLILIYSSVCAQTYTFTPAGSSGRYGPTQTQVNTSYTNTSLSGAVTVSSGIQSWTVPATGLYKIDMAGAKGGDGYIAFAGGGARMQGEFTFTVGQVLKLVVGQKGEDGHIGGGGGGSFVVDNFNTALIIAGGSGGAEYLSDYGFGASNNIGNSGTSGMPGSNGSLSVTASSGGSAGGGGSVATTYTTAQGSGGGGFSGNGQDGTPSTGGLSFLNGCTGGDGVSATSSIAGDGGFGGGGGADWYQNTGAGGGGGYSGGGGGTHFGLGGGGGSYNVGSNQANTSGANTGDGYIIFTKISGINIAQTASISCHGQLTAALTASAFGGAAPYTYSWTPNIGTGSIVTGLGAGAYTCVAVDANAAFYTNTFTIVQPAPLIGGITQTNVSCFAGSNGSAMYLVAGGTGAYSYTWSPFNAFSSSVTGLSAGIHSVTAKDANNCTVSRTLNITQPASLVISGFATNATVCSGQTSMLLGGGALTYTWSGNVTNAVTFSPAATTIYTVTGANAAGCTATATTAIYVNPSPTITIAGSTTLCTGNSLTLTANGADTYTWSTASNAGSISVSPVATTNYTLSGTASNGCRGTAIEGVNVLSTTSVAAISSSPAICSGNTVALSGSGALTYTWSNGITDAVAFSPGSTSEYSVVGTGACGTASAVITVTVHPLPTVTANATSTLVCIGSTVVLNGGGSSTYSWSNGVSNNLAFTVNANTTYTVTGTDANGCQNTAVTTISINPLPVVSASVSAGTICAGLSVTFNGGGANSYTWTGGVSNNSPFTPAANASYTVTGTDASGCQNTATTVVNVITSPVVNANATSLSVCAGNPVSLYGSGALSYTWSGSITDNAAFIPAATSVYTVFGSNACFTASDVITVTVNTLPLVNANASSTLVCEGATLNLSGTGALSYTWSGGVSNTVPFSVANTTIYTVTGTDANGCWNTASKTISVNPLPVVSLIATSLSVCAGASISLNASGADTYTLSTGSLATPLYPTVNTNYSLAGTHTLTGCSSTNTAIQSITVNALPTLSVAATSTAICMYKPVTLNASGADTFTWTNGITNGTSFNPTITTTYSVQGTNTLTGCTNSVSQLITVNALPSLSISVNNPSVCIGSAVVLTASGADSYNWTDNVLNGVPFTPTVSKAYAVTGTSSLTGCLSVAFQTLVVNPLPIVTSGASSLFICKGNTVIVQGQGADTYTFTNGITHGSPFSPQSTVNYSVSGTNTLTGCTSTNVTNQTIVVHELPLLSIVASQSILCSGEALTLSAIGAATYTWNTNEINSSISFTPSSSSTLNVVGIDANGCQGQAFFIVDVADCLGILPQAKNSELKIYPNPNNGEFYILSDVEVSLTIVNELGQTVRTIHVQDHSEAFRLSDLENGIYFIVGQKGNQRIRTKMVVAK